MKKILAPSLLSANFYNLEKDLIILKENNVEYLHLDVMDGLFVRNISFGIPVIKKIKENTKNDFILDTHLMIEKPELYIKNFKDAGADILTIHKEIKSDYKKVLLDIKKEGLKAGISINPETDVNEIFDVLNIVDLVLVMSVHPGFGGQKFIDSSIEKIRFLSKEKEELDYKYVIEVDGGINLENVKSVLDAGAEIVVAGSAVFNNDIRENILNFNKIL